MQKFQHAALITAAVIICHPLFAPLAYASEVVDDSFKSMSLARENSRANQAGKVPAVGPRRAILPARRRKALPSVHAVSRILLPLDSRLAGQSVK